jgi:uncharacterized protein YjdB
MANAFIFPNEIINTAVQLLQRKIVLPRLVWRDGLGDWRGRLNDTVSIRVLDPVASHQNTLRATGSGRDLIVSDLTEQTIDVKLDRRPYNLVHLTDEEESLDIQDFAVQVLARQVNSLGLRLEQNVADLITGAPYQSSNIGDSTHLYEAIVHADTALNEAEVPVPGRVLVVGSRFEEALRLDDRLIRTDSQGAFAEDALQRAKLGLIAGYQVIVSHALPKTAGFLFHPTAFAVVSRPPRAPYSGSPAAGATAADGGFALRWIGQWDFDAQTDRSLIDTFYGDSVISDPDKGLIRAASLTLQPTTIVIAPDAPSITAAAGSTHTVQLTATNNYGDNVTNVATWVSATPAKATVSPTGLVTGVASGTSVITATVGTITDTTTVTVT